MVYCLCFFFIFKNVFVIIFINCFWLRLLVYQTYVKATPYVLSPINLCYLKLLVRVDGLIDVKCDIFDVKEINFHFCFCTLQLSLSVSFVLFKQFPDLCFERHSIALKKVYPKVFAICFLIGFGIQ